MIFSKCAAALRNQIKFDISCDSSFLCIVKPYFLQFLREISQNLSSAAVLIGPLTLSRLWKKVILKNISRRQKSVENYPLSKELTLNAPIATKVVCFSCLLKCLRSLYGKQCGPRSDCSTLFASILNPSAMLGNYLQQTTSADIFRCIFFLGL